jgi:hypothetical protein
MYTYSGRYGLNAVLKYSLTVYTQTGLEWLKTMPWGGEKIVP